MFGMDAEFARKVNSLIAVWSQTRRATSFSRRERKPARRRQHDVAPDDFAMLICLCVSSYKLAICAAEMLCPDSGHPGHSSPTHRFEQKHTNAIAT